MKRGLRQERKQRRQTDALASVFTDKTRPQGSLSQETRMKKQKEDFPLVREDWV